MLPENLIAKLKMVADLPETARAGISYTMFGVGGILLFCVALLIWRRMRSKSYGSGGISNAQVEFEKRTDGVTVQGHNKPKTNPYASSTTASTPASTPAMELPTSNAFFRYVYV